MLKESAQVGLCGEDGEWLHVNSYRSQAALAGTQRGLTFGLKTADAQTGLVSGRG